MADRVTCAWQGPYHSAVERRHINSLLQYHAKPVPTAPPNLTNQYGSIKYNFHDFAASGHLL